MGLPVVPPSDEPRHRVADLWSSTLDHIKPVAEGGAHTAENLQAAHWICNIRKGDAWGPGKAEPSS
ncbi:HNH endonuclease [Streptomyces globisporus]|uniref:HNH endonuclease n=1 Tax=Streptomyces globisporus TaxID=1908 RepID=UPI0036DE1B06